MFGKLCFIVWVLLAAGLPLAAPPFAQGLAPAQALRQFQSSPAGHADQNVLVSPSQNAAPAAQLPADFQKLSNEAVGWLQGLLRINTTNPPGNELAAAKYMSGILTRESIPNEVIETVPGRGFLIARMNAGPVPDPAHALLLMGHLDVVGVQREKWTVDPFGGVIEDGYLYGRGAVDDKSMAIANMAVLIELKRSGARLSRDVILLAEGDEEQGGQFGMQVAVEKYWDKVACAFALNEEGRVVVKDGKVQYVGVQASEKVPFNVDVVATGASGHASIPLPDNPVVHLAAAVAKLGTYQAPMQLNSITRAYFEQLAPVEDDEIGKWMRALATPERQEHAGRVLSEASPLWNSMLRDTIAPTMLQAGIRANVIPSEARATLNIRLLPGNLLAPLLQNLEKVVADPQVRFVPQASIGEAAPSSSLETSLFDSIARIVQQEFPGAAIVPMMSTGATDSVYLRVRNVQAYGLPPFPLTEGDLARKHGNDERIPVNSFRKGIEFLYRVTSAFAASS